jgi:lysozyme
LGGQPFVIRFYLDAPAQRRSSKRNSSDTPSPSSKLSDIKLYKTPAQAGRSKVKWLYSARRSAMPLFIPGIDVSRWQGSINWPAVQTTGKLFAFIKATEGSGLVDPFFAANWKGAKDAGLLCGAYHFFRPLQDAKKQAELFLKSVKLESGDFPPVLDLEVSENLRAATIIQRVEIWVSEIEKQTGKKVILYSGISFLNDSFTIPAGGPPLWARDHILWVANYLPPTAIQPFMPAGWDKWHFWQYSQAGQVDGINGSVDLDWYNGSLEELQALAGKSATPVSKQLYNVEAGDTWTGVAAQFQVSIEDLALANPQILQPGAVLNIPLSSTSPGSSPSINDNHEPAGLRTYTVQPGDSLSRIAVRFNTTISAIALANAISDPNQIQVGQVLVIPDPTPFSDFTPM